MRRLKPLLKLLILLGILIIPGAIIYSIIEQSSTKPKVEKPFSQRNIPNSPHRQSADTPRSIAAKHFDPRFTLLRATERFLLPTITSTSAPLGSSSGALTYDAQPFNTPNPKRGGLHSGHDLNGIGGQNTDKGDPIYALADGLVLYRGSPSPDWGNVIILGHRLPDGQIIQSLYAHIDNPRVIHGQLVGKNRLIGNVGTAGDRYWAHLHLEIIRSSALEAGRPAYGSTTMNRLHHNEIMTKPSLSSGFFIPYNLFSHLRELESTRQRSNIQFKTTQNTPQP